MWQDFTSLTMVFTEYDRVVIQCLRQNKGYSATSGTVYLTLSPTTWTSLQILSKRNSKRFITLTASRRFTWPPAPAIRHLMLHNNNNKFGDRISVEKLEKWRFDFEQTWEENWWQWIDCLAGRQRSAKNRQNWWERRMCWRRRLVFILSFNAFIMQNS